MEFRRLGRSGLTVSAVGLGTNNLGMKLDMDGSREVVHAALDQGITLFDTADSYGASEERLGELLEGRRDDVILATKFGGDAAKRGNGNGADWGARGARRYVVRAVEASLRRLRTDWIDLYQLHRPDPLTPIEETLAALTDLVRAGKVRYVGSSNFTGWQVAEADWTSRTRGLERMISAQNEYSWLERDLERDLVPALKHYGVGLLPYFPLASGVLTGKYQRGHAAPEGSRIQSWGREESLTDRTFDVVEKLEAFATERGLTVLDVAIGGLAAKPTVASVIAGATSAEQVARNVAAGAWRPTVAELRTLDEMTAPPPAEARFATSPPACGRRVGAAVYRDAMADEDRPWEPPFAGTEAEHLLGALDRLRTTFRWKVDDLDAAGLQARIGASTLSLGRLLKHLAVNEDYVSTTKLSGEPLGEPWDVNGWASDEDWELTSADDDTPEQLYALWDGAVERSRARFGAALAAGGPAQLVHVSGPDGRHASLRRLLCDLIEEYGRHTGHADLLREAVDGRVGEDPPRGWRPKRRTAG